MEPKQPDGGDKAGASFLCRLEQDGVGVSKGRFVSELSISRRSLVDDHAFSFPPSSFSACMRVCVCVCGSPF